MFIYYLFISYKAVLSSLVKRRQLTIIDIYDVILTNVMPHFSSYLTSIDLASASDMMFFEACDVFRCFLTFLKIYKETIFDGNLK